jgi:deoxyxylulose-5-phosphate synthase
MPDRMIAHATRKEQLTEIGLDPAGIAASVRDSLKKDGVKLSIAVNRPEAKLARA